MYFATRNKIKSAVSILLVSVLWAALVSVPVFASFETVNLRDAVNMGFKDEVEADKKGGWTDQGTNDLREMPVGMQTFKDIPFDIINPKTNNGKSCIVLSGTEKPYFPKQTTIEINKKAKTIYFLHAAAWAISEVVAEYIITYDDGSKTEAPLTGYKEISEWYRPVDTGYSFVAWKWHNPYVNVDVGINLYEWENPLPQKTIRNIIFKTMDKKTVPVLLAITLSPDPAKFIKNDRRFQNQDSAIEFNGINLGNLAGLTFGWITAIVVLSIALPWAAIIVMLIIFIKYFRLKKEFKHTEIMAAIEKGNYQPETFATKPKRFILKSAIFLSCLLVGLGLGILFKSASMILIGLGLGMIAGIFVINEYFK
ncbi:MAG: hypothetical protein A3J83_09045 [Elusimicrobia bacterium RIFOXYA2_FULL_40_6]|nr:MAG: hypothetical protein A3J83_09045 [Elusimicrobia bacterium RIFOXYA2_FULL_40_6]